MARCCPCIARRQVRRSPRCAGSRRNCTVPCMGRRHAYTHAHTHAYTHTHTHAHAPTLTRTLPSATHSAVPRCLSPPGTLLRSAAGSPVPTTRHLTWACHCRCRPTRARRWRRGGGGAAPCAARCAARGVEPVPSHPNGAGAGQLDRRAARSRRCRRRRCHRCRRRRHRGGPLGGNRVRDLLRGGARLRAGAVRPCAHVHAVRRRPRLVPNVPLRRGARDPAVRRRRRPAAAIGPSNAEFLAQYPFSPRPQREKRPPSPPQTCCPRSFVVLANHDATR
eukprot:scaffold25577_cov53-Phaeocystis_antarctica.AAC.2